MVTAFREKYAIVFFAYICIVSSLFASNNEELFLRGNKYYADHNYDDAFAVYNLISKKGSPVLYNMGNCLFNKEDYAGALLYWSRAESGATLHEYKQILHNKELALKKLGKQKEQSWWQKMIESFQSTLPAVSLLLLQLFFLICWWLLILVMRKKQTGSGKIIRTFLYCCITIFAMILGVNYTKQNKHSAIIVKKEAHLFAGPDKSFYVLSPITYADYAAVKETREGWYKIQYADMIGWVEEDVIQII